MSAHISYAIVMVSGLCFVTLALFVTKKVADRLDRKENKVTHK